MTLEKAILKILGEHIAHPECHTYKITSYDLTHDGEGWSVNYPFTIGSSVPLSEALETARARWEVFKVNYLPRARVSDIADIGEGDVFELECDCTPFLQIERNNA